MKILGIQIGRRSPEQEAADALHTAKLSLGETRFALEHYQHQEAMLTARIARLQAEVDDHNSLARQAMRDWGPREPKRFGGIWPLTALDTVTSRSSA